MKKLYHIFTNKYSSNYIVNGDSCIYCGESVQNLYSLLSYNEKVELITKFRYVDNETIYYSEKLE